MDTTKLLAKWLLLVFQAFVFTRAKIDYIVPFLPLNVTDVEPGSPWPQPKSIRVYNEVFELKKSQFSFNTDSFECSLVAAALERYLTIIFDEELVSGDSGYDQVTELALSVTGDKGCETYPTLESDESYLLTINSEGSIATLTSPEIWGILRGLETFSQLVYQSEFGEFLINRTDIDDEPRYNHRGLLVDTSRHFIPVSYLYRNLDAMAYNKLNVFHWHLVDHQSFPYKSIKYPQLSDEGAYDPIKLVYTQENVAAVIEYARQRGIRVIPEFDTPGHTQSWRSIENLLTACYADGEPAKVVYGSHGAYGPINPSIENNFVFLREFFQEVVQVFPDEYVHLGADEVMYDCWMSNPEISEFMANMSFGDQYSLLEEYYQTRLFEIIKDLGARYIIWQDPIDNNVTVNENTIVQVWKDSSLDPVLPPYREGLKKATKLGLKTLLSSCWYLNYVEFSPDWKRFYQCEPTDFEGTDEQKNLIFGGEACIWSEYTDGSNFISKVWPRASAIAERLWSPVTVTDLDLAQVRLDQHRCRMVRRGINAQPIGPGYCGKYEVEEESCDNRGCEDLTTTQSSENGTDLKATSCHLIVILSFIILCMFNPFV